MRDNAPVTSHPASGFLPEALKRAREAAGMSRAELAEVVGGNRMAVYRWETGARTPQVSTVALLARAVGVDPSDLIAPPQTLSQLRASRGLLQSEVAEQIGVARSRYSSIELGTGRATREQLLQLAEVFDVEIGTLEELLPPQ